MLSEHARAVVRVFFEDREGNQRSMSLSFPFSLSLDSIQTYMAIWVSRVGPLSNASIHRYTVVHTLEDDEPASPSGDSTVAEKLVLFYRNEAFFDRIYIPALRQELLETEGVYAGVRLDVALPEVITILESMNDVVAYIVTPEGEDFPTEFVVGGLVL